MKKKLLLIMAILCLVALLAGLLVACNDKPAPQPEPPTDPSEPAEPGETGGLEFYLKEDGTYMVSNYTGSETDVVIPVKHDNKAVTEIGPSAFAYRSLITSITIPSSVTKIGDQAFYNCLSLTTINYNAAAVENKGIDSEVFRNAGTQGEGITLTFGNNVTSIPDNLFYATKAPNIVTMTTGACVQSIGEQTFANLPTLTTVTISNSVTEIAATAFEDSTGITTATMPISAVNKVPQNSLRTVTLTDGEYLGYDPSGAGMESVGFAGCLTLESVTLPETIEHIGASTFAACKELRSLTIPETAEVMAIGDQAFYMCMALGSVTIPETVESIGDSAFFGCRSITTVNIPASVEDIGASAFADCGSLESITVAAENANYYAYEEKTLIEMSYEFSGDYDEEGLPVMVRTFEDIVVAGATGSSIPEEYSVVAIAAGAFYGSGIQSIVVPDNVKAIGESAFGGCTALSDITLPFVGTSTTGFGYIFGTSPYIEDFFYDEELEEIVFTYSDAETLVINGINQKEYYVPTTLTTVTVSGFYENDGYGDLPAGDIYPYAFSGFTTLTSVAIGGGVESIGSYAFENCTSITGIVVPASVGSIGSYAFADCVSLDTVDLGEGVTSIGSYAFENCTSITGIVVPESVTSIGQGAFAGCSDLEEMTLPFVGSSRNGNTSSSNHLFGYIFGGDYQSSSDFDYVTQNYSDYSSEAYYIPSGLTTVTITGAYDSYDDAAVSIGYGAFEECDMIDSLTIGDGVYSIGAYAFRDCTSLTEMVVPESVTSIGEDAFAGCYNIAEITLPFVGSSRNGNTSSSNHLFGYIFGYGDQGSYSSYYTGVTQSYSSGYSTTNYIPSGLTTVTITGADDDYGNAAVSIGYGAFEECDMIDSLTIGDGVYSIGAYAFRDCTSLTEMVVPESVTSIGEDAFAGCYNIAEITLPFVGSSRNGNTSSSNHLFGYIFGYGDQGSYSSYYTGVTQSYSSGYSTTNYIPSGLTTVTITGADDDYGNAAVSIGYGAFYDCDMIENVTIGDGVTSIGSYAFYDCDGLTDFTTDSTGQIGSYAFNSCGYLDTVDLGESVTSIGSYAFQYTPITEIVIPDSVGSIGSYAFADCASLDTVDLGEGVTSIGSYAFENCTSLTEMVVPDSVTSIGEDAFAGCYNIAEITLPFVGASKTSGGTSSGVFGYIFGYGDQGSYSSYYIGVTQYYTSGYSTYNYIPSELATVTVTGGNSSYSLPYGAFYNCGMIESVTLGDNVTAIGERAFYDCDGLTDLSVTDSIESVDDEAFYGCDNLTYNVSGNVNYLGNADNKYAVLVGAASTSLTSVTIDSATRVILPGAFADCTSLTEVVVPDSVVEIGEGAFAGCYNLTEITLPFVGRNDGSGSSSHLFGYIFGLGSQSSDNYTNAYQRYGSSSYTYYYIPSGLTTVTVTGGNGYYDLAYGAFSGCTMLESVTLGDDVDTIGSYAFEDCTSLATVDLAEGITEVGSHAFDGCTALTEIVLPDSMDYINSYAFNNSGLTAVDLGSGIYSIAADAFYGTGITSVVIPDGIYYLYDGAFNGCSSLAKVYYEGTETDWNSLIGRYGNGDISGATVYYYTDSEPELNAEGTAYVGSYWYYVDGVVTEWVYEAE